MDPYLEGIMAKVPKDVRMDVHIFSVTSRRFYRAVAWERVLVVNERTVARCGHFHDHRREAEVCQALDARYSAAVRSNSGV